MLKPITLAALGLAAAVQTAQADTILSYPFGPFHAPDTIVSPYDNPSFDRFVEMCDAFGIDCSVPEADSDGGVFGTSPEALADAEKRLHLYTEEWGDFIEEMEERYTAPRIEVPRADPFTLFGWNHTPRVPQPLFVPRPFPRTDVYPFGHHIPSVPRIEVPHPFTFPHGALPRGPVFPWPSL